MAFERVFYLYKTLVSKFIKFISFVAQMKFVVFLSCGVVTLYNLVIYQCAKLPLQTKRLWLFLTKFKFVEMFKIISTYFEMCAVMTSFYIVIITWSSTGWNLSMILYVRCTSTGYFVQRNFAKYLPNSVKIYQVNIYIYIYVRCVYI